MSYTLKIGATAKREFRRLPLEIRERIRTVIDSLAEEPRPRGAKKLTYPSNAYRVRIGKYRVVYTILERGREVRIIAIGHRRDVYRLSEG